MNKAELDNNHSDTTTQTPNGTTWENTGHDKWANFEQMFKDTQWAFTKSTTSLYKVSRMLVDTNPRALLDIEDDKVVTKILQEKWNVDNIEELNMLYPFALKDKNLDEDETELSKIDMLERKIQLSEYRDTKIKTEEAIASALESNKILTQAIPDIDDKIRRELKNISSELDAKERVRRAISIVSNEVDFETNAYALLRWVTVQKWASDLKSEEAYSKEKQDELRKAVRRNNNI